MDSGFQRRNAWRDETYPNLASRNAGATRDYDEYKSFKAGSLYPGETLQSEVKKGRA